MPHEESVQRVFSPSLPVSDVNAEHPEYNQETLIDYWRFYRGGADLLDNATDYLIRREFEPAATYIRRVAAAYYINYVGSILGWYGQILFRIEPIIALEPETDPENKSESRQERWFAAFKENVDGASTHLADFLKRVVTESLVFRTSYVLVDFPATDAPPSTRAQQVERGLDRPVLTYYSALNAVNWQKTGKKLDWVIFRTSSVDPVPLSRDKIFTWEWHYWDRTHYAVYQVQKTKTGRTRNDPTLLAGDQADLIASGPHSMAAQQEVPVVCLDLSDDLWLMNRVFGVAKENFNAENAMSRAVEQGLFALPVIKSDEEFKGLVGESYFIQLGEKDDFLWAEPAGTTYELAGQRLERLKDEIYRTLGIISQAEPASNAEVRQSGYSKERDFQTTKELLLGLGMETRAFLQQLVRIVQAVSGYKPKAQVTGMEDFDVRDNMTIINEATSSVGLVPSPKFASFTLAKVVKKLADDATQAQQTAMIAEIQTNIAKGIGPLMPTNAPQAKDPAQEGNTSKNQPPKAREALQSPKKPTED